MRWRRFLYSRACHAVLFRHLMMSSRKEETKPNTYAASGFALPDGSARLPHGSHVGQDPRALSQALVEAVWGLHPLKPSINSAVHAPPCSRELQSSSMRSWDVPMRSECTKHVLNVLIQRKSEATVLARNVFSIKY